MLLLWLSCDLQVASRVADERGAMLGHEVSVCVYVCMYVCMYV